MQTENFESKIRRITGTFNRRPPAQTWENIQQALGGNNGMPSPGRKGLRWGLPLGLAAAILIIGVIIWPQFNPKIHWMDNYWDALALAEREHKPLLLLFTRNCADCKAFDQILAKSHINEKTDHYIAVRLHLDDPTPLDSSSVMQLFPEKRKKTDQIPGSEKYTLEMVERDITLKNWGDVWAFWLDDKFHSQRPPVLVLITPQEERIAQFNYVLNKELTAGEIEQAVDYWLGLQLEVLAGDHIQGQKLFVNLCASCHNSNMKDHLTGPALGGIRKKWSDYPEEDLYDYIRNSQQMISEGHPLALASWNEWKPTIMTSFPDLSDGELKKLVDYIEWRYEEE